jgi:tagatose 6-phosphate kinase
MKKKKKSSPDDQYKNGKGLRLILTITLNPSVDIRYTLNSFRTGTINRVEQVSKTAGGKGLNVARVLRQLGEPVAVSGFLGGELGDYIRAEIAQLGIRDAFIPIRGRTRNCIAILHQGRQTEILESGPVIEKSEQEQFLRFFSEYSIKSKVITISGSLPKGVPDRFYEQLLDKARGVPVLLDTKGSLLKKVLASGKKPYLIKPNQDELNDMLGTRLEPLSQLIGALKSPLFAGVPWIVVTLGEKGAVIKHKGVFYRAEVPRIKPKNPVGSGDSVIAGFAAGMARGLDGERLIRFGLSMGVLNAMEEKTGFIDPRKLDDCMKEIRIETVHEGPADEEGNR